MFAFVNFLIEISLRYSQMHSFVLSCRHCLNHSCSGFTECSVSFLISFFDRAMFHCISRQDSRETFNLINCISTSKTFSRVNGLCSRRSVELMVCLCSRLSKSFGIHSVQSHDCVMILSHVPQETYTVFTRVDRICVCFACLFEC